MEKLYTSPAEILKTVEVQSIEQECLDNVFSWLINRDKNKEEANKDFITNHQEIEKELQDVKENISKTSEEEDNDDEATDA